MTVEAGSQTITFSCSGSTAYPFTFSIGDEDDIKVTLTHGTTTTVLVKDTDYTVTGTAIEWDISGNPTAYSYATGGTVTTVTAYGSDYTLSITTDIEFSQGSSFYTGMGALPKITENALDKLTRICKQMQAQIIALQISIVTGGPVSTTDIVFLGYLDDDPDTTGWGSSEKGYQWFNNTDGRGKYWDGTEVIVF